MTTKDQLKNDPYLSGQRNQSEDIEHLSYQKRAIDFKELN